MSAIYFTYIITAIELAVIYSLCMNEIAMKKCCKNGSIYSGSDGI
jgi:hypothetical protein